VCNGPRFPLLRTLNNALYRRQAGIKVISRARIFKLFRSPRINSVSLCSLAGPYDNPIIFRFLAVKDCLKIQAQTRHQKRCLEVFLLDFYLSFFLLSKVTFYNKFCCFRARQPRYRLSAGYRLFLPQYWWQDGGLTKHRHYRRLCSINLCVIRGKKRKIMTATKASLIRSQQLVRWAKSDTRDL
jgi:hypothetical protein